MDERPVVKVALRDRAAGPDQRAVVKVALKDCGATRPVERPEHNPDVDQRLLRQSSYTAVMGVLCICLGLGVWGHAVASPSTLPPVAGGIIGTLVIALGAWYILGARDERRLAHELTPSRRAWLERALATVRPEPMLLRVSFELLRYNYKHVRATSGVPFEDWEYCASLYLPGARPADEPEGRYRMPVTRSDPYTAREDALLLDPLGAPVTPARWLMAPPALRPVQVYRVPAADPDGPTAILVDLGGSARFVCAGLWWPSSAKSYLDAWRESSVKWQL